jgi:RNA-directed DNA polymerase
LENRNNEETQMTAEVYAGASSAGQQWHDINSHVMEQQVFRLQTRIAKAIKAGRYSKAKALQWLLARSFAAKYLAVMNCAGTFRLNGYWKRI